MLTLKSSVDGIEWPVMPSRLAQAILSVVLQLEQSQWLAPEEIERRQLTQLRRLVLYAQRHVPFYRDRLQPVAERIAKASLTPELWAEIPILTRSDIQEAGESLHARGLPRGHGKIGSTVTSGSTGEPIEVRHSDLFQCMWRAITIRNHIWHKRDFTGALAMIRGRVGSQAGYPEGARSRNWGVTAYAGIQTGPLLALDINCTPAQQVDWLIRNAPAYFITHPTNLQRLLMHSREEDIRIPGLREVQTVAEILTAEVRQLTRQAWGVPVVDMYTSRDVGYLALQCPQLEHYHAQSEVTRLELLDESGRPCAPGEVGRVTVTALHEFAMPLIRYQIGDHAELGAPCPCGRGLPVLRRILGRTQQMLTLPDGQKLWTIVSESKLLDFMNLAPIRQFQFVQKTPQAIEVRLAVARGLTESEENEIRAWVAASFGHPFEVSFTYFDEIPLTAEGKFFDFMSEVEG